MANRLEHSMSPYLRQHAGNPVDWWEWSTEAFDEARRRDVPVFVSIGYAACHWCHVMAHESFEDAGVAAVLNERFVAVKVDREERPDVDAIYMDVTVALTGQGGWPMSVWLTPEGHAFHAGTYYPPTPHPRLPSFRQVLDAVHEAWTQRRGDVESGAAHITAALAGRSGGSTGSGRTATAADVAVALDALASQHDDGAGGFGGAPKFPPSTVLDALVARAAQGDGPDADRAWALASRTLEAMTRGGIYDQLGGGFARYAVDAGWVVPHFEKMLYDNALLIGVHARAAVEARRRGETDDAGRHERVVVETVGWLLREMRTEQGAFAASLDADSAPTPGAPPMEGAFYAWTPGELVDVLGREDGERAAAALTVTAAGTFEGGASTLQLLHDPDDAAWLSSVRDRLRVAREERPRPARDDKVVAAWNGWAIASLVDAAMLLDRPDWLDAARTAAEGVHRLHTVRGRLRRVSLAGEVSGAPGAADDHAGLAHGFALLSGATGEAVWLDRALALLERLDAHFGADDGGLFDTADDAEQLVRRPRDPAENATPSGASAALRGYRLAARLTGDARWRDRADAVAATVAPLVAQAPRAAGWALADAVAETGARRPAEVAVLLAAQPASGSGTVAEPATAVGDVWRAAPPGSAVAVGRPTDPGADSPTHGPIPLLAGRTTLEERTTYYVCHDHVCDIPVLEVDAVRARLG